MVCHRSSLYQFLEENVSVCVVFQLNYDPCIHSGGRDLLLLVALDAINVGKAEQVTTAAAGYFDVFLKS